MITFEEMQERLLRLDTASLADANKSIRVLDPEIRPICEGVKLVGRARTVECVGDFLTVVLTLAESKSGEVLVIVTSGSRGAVAGELFSTECARRGVSGIVIDGACRDTAEIRKMQFPVYSRNRNPVSGTVERLFKTQISVEIGGVLISPGDIVFGDDDGVVICTEAEMQELIPAAEEIQRKEGRVLRAMGEGASLFDFLNFESHVSDVRAGKESRLKFEVE